MVRYDYSLWHGSLLLAHRHHIRRQGLLWHKSDWIVLLVHVGVDIRVLVLLLLSHINNLRRLYLRLNTKAYVCVHSLNHLILRDVNTVMNRSPRVAELLRDLLELLHRSRVLHIAVLNWMLICSEHGICPFY